MNYTNAIALQADGKIVVGGMFNLQVGLLRLTPAGMLDTSFDVDGIVTNHFGDANEMNEIKDLVVLGDGKLVAVGSCYQNTIERILAVKYLTNGSLDPNFANAGAFISN